MLAETRQYLRRWVEQIIVVAAGGFLAAFQATSYDFTKAGLGAALGAALMAVYGFIVKPVGDKDKPNVVG